MAALPQSAVTFGAARPALAVLVAAITLAAVLGRPRGAPEGLSAAAGAAAMVLLGLAAPGNAGRAIAGNWNVLLFFAGLLAVAGLADEAGVFDAVTGIALRAGGRSPLRLLMAVCAAGCVVTAFLSNDATALILTPVVALAAQRAGADPVPYALATSYIADAASGLLPVANPVNILTIDATHVALGTYLGVLLLPAVLVVVATVAALAWALRGRLQPLRTATPGGVPSPLVRPAAAVLVALAVAYVAATSLRLPVGLVAAAGAVALATVVGRRAPRRLQRLRSDVSWSVLLFVAGLFVVVQGLEDTGVTGAVLHWWLGAGSGSTPSAVAAFGGAALGSNLINNLPMTLVTLSGLHPLGAAATNAALGAALGADVGPNLTPLGSLATMLWLVLLRSRGISISAATYVRYGILVTVPALAAGAVGLLVTTR
ncbi:MAG: SLC13 family permease [Candidatus Dormibacteria bacterium]